MYKPKFLRFEHSTVTYDQKAAKYAVSYTTINAFQQDNTPRSKLGSGTNFPLFSNLRCSAKELDDRREKEA